MYVNGSLADAGPTTAGDVALRAGLGSSRPPREIDVAQTKKWVTSLLLGRDEDAPAAKAAPAPSQEGILARMERVAGRQEGLSWRERLASSDESLLAKMARVEATLGLSGASQPLVARVAAAQRAVGLPPQAIHCGCSWMRSSPRSKDVDNVNVELLANKRRSLLPSGLLEPLLQLARRLQLGRGRSVILVLALILILVLLVLTRRVGRLPLRRRLGARRNLIGERRQRGL